MSDSWNIDVIKADSLRVCYFIMPEKVNEDVRQLLESASDRYQCSMVILSGVNWNDDLTPWSAPGIFRDKTPFGGRAADFMGEFQADCCWKVEAQLNLSSEHKSVERYLVGVSLSGLFAIWSMAQPSCHDIDFAGVASISGSFWYDGFCEWLSANPVKVTSTKVFVSLGDREKNSKDKRMGRVQDCTDSVVSTLQDQGLSVDYRIVPGTHFSPIVPRLDLALKSLFE